METCFPLIKSSRKPLKKKTWLTQEIINQSKEKRALYERFVQDRNNVSLKIAYSQMSRSLKKKVITAKQESESELFRGCRNKPKQMWRLINKFVGKTKAQNIKHLGENDNIISQPNTISDIFQNYSSFPSLP